MFEARIEEAAVERDLVIDLRDPEVTGRADAPAPQERRDRDRRRSVVLLVALNVLNAVDTALTNAVTAAGLAEEANPLVEWLTLPGKTVFVAALSLLLWKLRPRALVVPVIAYALVVCYTIVGAALYA